MNYYFICDNCGHNTEFKKSMKEGPPYNVDCDQCSKQMRHELGGNFILKGNGWPSKDINKSQYLSGQMREENDQKHLEDQRNNRLVDEVLQVRRKGKKAMKQFSTDNPQKIKDYKSALKKGYRAKNNKSK